jgi:hypothetical protein
MKILTSTKLTCKGTIVSNIFIEKVTGYLQLVDFIACNQWVRFGESFSLLRGKIESAVVFLGKPMILAVYKSAFAIVSHYSNFL